MKSKSFTLIGTMLLTAFLVPSTATAQAPPMDMSWAIQRQMVMQQHGDYTAHATAMAYYNYMVALRARGYTGPSLPTGVTTQSLQRSIQGANNAGQRYIQGGMSNSNRTSNAIYDYGMRAIRGCSLYNGRYYCY